METLFASTLTLNADSVETLPLCFGSKEYISVACYQLDEASGIRHGSIGLYSCGDTGIDPSLSLENQLEFPGVLDVKW